MALFSNEARIRHKNYVLPVGGSFSYADFYVYGSSYRKSNSMVSDGTLSAVLSRDRSRVAYATTQAYTNAASTNLSVSAAYDIEDAPDDTVSTDLPWSRYSPGVGFSISAPGLRAVPRSESYPFWDMTNTTTPTSTAPRTWTGEYSTDNAVCASIRQNGNAMYLSVQENGVFVVNNAYLSIVNGTTSVYTYEPKLVVHSATNIWIFHKVSSDNTTDNLRLYLSVWDGTSVVSTTLLSVGNYDPYYDVIPGDFGYSYLAYTLKDTSNYDGEGPVNSRLFVRSIQHSTLTLSSVLSETLIFSGETVLSSVGGARANSSYVFRYKGKSYFVYAAPTYVVAVFVVEDSTPNTVTLLRYGVVPKMDDGSFTRPVASSIAKYVGIEYDPVSDKAYLVCIFPIEWGNMPDTLRGSDEARRIYIVRHWQALDATAWSLSSSVVPEMLSYVPQSYSGLYRRSSVGCPGYIPSRRGSQTAGALWVQFTQQTPDRLPVPTKYIYDWGLEVVRVANWYDPSFQDGVAEISLQAGVSVTASVFVEPDAVVHLAVGVTVSGYRNRTVLFPTYWGGEKLTFVDAVVSIPLLLGVDVTGKIPGNIDAEAVVSLGDSSSFGVYAAAQVLTILVCEYGYLYVGTTFLEEFHGYVNEERATVWGLPPLQIMGSTPDTADVLRALDIAQVHSDDMAHARWHAHGAAVFPVGWQTALERLDKVTSLGGENIQAQVGIYPTGQDPLPSAFDFWDAWKNSPVHYAQMMLDWDAYSSSNVHANMFSSLALTYGRSPLYDGGGPPYDTYPIVALPDYGVYAFSIYATNNFLLIKENEVESLLYERWQTDALDCLLLDEMWLTSAVVNCKAANSIMYSVRVSSQHSTPYGYFAAKAHVALSTHSLDAGHTSAYSYSYSVISSAFDVPYSLNPLYVSAPHDALWECSVTALHDVLYDDMLRVASYVDATYGEPYPVKSQHVAVYSALAGANRTHTVGVALGPKVRAGFGVGYDLLLLNPALRQTVYAYDMLDDDTGAVFSAPQMMLHMGGESIEVSDGYIACDYDSPGFSFSCRIDDAAFVRSAKVTDRFDVVFEGTPYTFFLSNVSSDSPAKSATETISIQGLSPVFLLDAPYAETIVYAPDTQKRFSDIVTEVLGVAVSFDDHIDWFVPAGRAQGANQTPLSLANEMLASVGSRLLSRPDGSLYVKTRYPVGLDAPTSTPAYVFDDTLSTFSKSSSYEFARGYNRFRIRDSESSYNDKIEFDEESSIASVWVSPYRSSWRLDCTTSTNLLLNDLGEVVEEKEEVLDFSSGAASTKYPILSITSLSWLTDSLGGVSFEPYSDKLTVSTAVNFGYGIARVVYMAKCSKFKITTTDTIEATQLIVVEV